MSITRRKFCGAMAGGPVLLLMQGCTTHLSGARKAARIRTKAQAGRRILDWLAKLDQPSTQDDAELVEAVERWIAASATSDDASVSRGS